MPPRHLPLRRYAPRRRRVTPSYLLYRYFMLPPYAAAAFTGYVYYLLSTIFRVYHAASRRLYIAVRRRFAADCFFDDACHREFMRSGAYAEPRALHYDTLRYV